MQQYCPECGEACSTLVQQTVDIALPISLTPAVHLEGIQIACCGAPQIECCPDEDCCGGLSLKITQTITYKIPITYQVEAITGEVTTECRKKPTDSPCGKYRYST